MEIKKKLLKPFFEGYKLTLNDSIKVDYYPLEASVMKQREFNSSEYQVMADEIYDNKLKSSDNSLLYYISCEGALVSFSRETLKSSVVHVGPIDSFTITNSGVVFILTGKKLLLHNDSRLSASFYELEITGDEFKLLKANTVSIKTILLIQSIGKLKDFNKEAGEKTAFGFYRIELKGSELVCCDLLGWSLTRPSVVIIDGDRVILGTSSGSTTEGSDDTTIDTLTDAPHEFTNVFNDEEEDEENDLLNNCRLTEFINSKASDQAPFPEFTVSGVCVNEFQVPIKHLYDVNVYDLRNNEHIATFPAINFIQNGKIDKKFSVFGRNFVFIIETSGNIYCYAKPADDDKVSPQYLIQLEEEIFGFARERDEMGFKEVLYLLTKEKIYRLELQ